MPWPIFENKAFIGVNRLRTRAARGGTRVCYAKLPFRPRTPLAGFHLQRNQIPDPPRAIYPGLDVHAARRNAVILRENCDKRRLARQIRAREVDRLPYTYDVYIIAACGSNTTPIRPQQI